jgi:transcriptional regulator with XRE-family HTH domain
MQPNEILDNVIKAKGLKKAELARKSGVPASDIGAYTSGRRDLYGDRLIAVVRAMPIDAQASYWIYVSQSSITGECQASTTAITA